MKKNKKINYFRLYFIYVFIINNNYQIISKTNQVEINFQLEPDEQDVFELIQQNKREHIDVIAQKSQKSIANIAVVLLNLEIKGLIKKTGGNVFGLA